MRVIAFLALSPQKTPVYSRELGRVSAPALCWETPERDMRCGESGGVKLMSKQSTKARRTSTRQNQKDAATRWLLRYGPPWSSAKPKESVPRRRVLEAGVGFVWSGTSTQGNVTKDKKGKQAANRSPYRPPSATLIARGVDFYGLPAVFSLLLVSCVLCIIRSVRVFPPPTFLPTLSPARRLSQKK